MIVHVVELGKIPPGSKVGLHAAVLRIVPDIEFDQLQCTVHDLKNFCRRE